MHLLVCRTAGDALATFSDYWTAHEELCHLPFSLCLRMAAAAPSAPCLVMAIVEDPPSSVRHGPHGPGTILASLLHSDPTKPVFLQAPGAPRESVHALLDAWQGETEYSGGCSGVVAEPAVASQFLEFLTGRRRLEAPAAACTGSGTAGSEGSPAVHRLFQEFLVQRVPVPPARPAPGACVRADSSHEALLTAWCTDFHVETFRHVPPMVAHAATVGPANAVGLLARGAAYLWVLEDGTPVSLVAVNGMSPTLVRIGSVYTPPEARGKGYATHLVSAVAALTRTEHGRTPCLFVDVSNPTSVGVYTKLGFEPSAAAPPSEILYLS